MMERFPLSRMSASTKTARLAKAKLSKVASLAPGTVISICLIPGRRRRRSSKKFRPLTSASKTAAFLSIPDQIPLASGPNRRTLKHERRILHRLAEKNCPRHPQNGSCYRDLPAGRDIAHFDLSCHRATYDWH